jgi:catechol 2,3-dioxygenase-like lactoylglutathione lyase family enzyme
MITGLWHASFTVKDIERTIHFYRDILGMDLVHTQEQSNAYTRKLVQYPDANLKVAMFSFPGHSHHPSGHVIELIEYVSPPGEYVPPGTAHVRSGHIAFVVENIHEYVKELKSKGVMFKSEVVPIEAGRNKGGYSVYFWDPDEITLELLQPPKTLN